MLKSQVKDTLQSTQSTGLNDSQELSVRDHVWQSMYETRESFSNGFIEHGSEHTPQTPWVDVMLQQPRNRHELPQFTEQFHVLLRLLLFLLESSLSFPWKLQFLDLEHEAALTHHQVLEKKQIYQEIGR